MRLVSIISTPICFGSVSQTSRNRKLKTAEARGRRKREVYDNRGLSTTYDLLDGGLGNVYIPYLRSSSSGSQHDARNAIE